MRARVSYFKHSQRVFVLAQSCGRRRSDIWRQETTCRSATLKERDTVADVRLRARRFVSAYYTFRAPPPPLPNARKETRRRKRMRMHVKLLSCLRAMHECARPMLSHASESQAGTATAAGGEIYVRGNDTSLLELKPLAPPWTAVSCYNTSSSLLVARH